MNWTALFVVGFLLFGVLNTLTTKIQFTIQSEGVGGESKAFKKPWLGVSTMFAGMAINLLFHFIQTRRTGKGKDEPLLKATEPPQSCLKTFMIVGVPAVFDLVTTGLNYMGAIVLSASIWQMLRSANIIFSALFAVVFLKRQLCGFHWLGVAVVMLGICMVGTANSLSAQAAPRAPSATGAGSGAALFGTCMVLLAAAFSGGQVITEEKLLKSMNVPALLLVGYEGVWGMLLLFGALLPVMYIIPGHDAGSYENTYDSFLMLRNSTDLQRMVGIYVFSCTIYNLCAVCVTGALSAVHRTMFMASRTMIVWIIDVWLHYFVSPDIPFSEAWNIYSYLELAGFLVLVSGQAIYAGILRVPGMSYQPAEANLSEPSPGRSRAPTIDLQSPVGDISPTSAKLMSPGLPNYYGDSDGADFELKVDGTGKI